MIKQKYNKKLWKDIAKSLKTILSNFTNDKKKLNFREDQIRMYINKTEEQYNIFKSLNLNSYKLCSPEKLNINGRYFLNFEVIWPKIKKKIIKKYINKHCSFNHGDLCFSNI